MTAVLFGVFVASLVGSVHCLAMCGPLVGLHGGARTMRLAGTHALGRMTTYVALGVLAGLVGSAVNLAGQVASVQRTATIAAAALIVGMGLWQVASSWKVSRIRDKSTSSGARGRAGSGDSADGNRAAVGSMFASALVRIRPKTAAKRSYLIGTLTGLLPCGWLWAFIIAAAGTGSPISGGVTMFAFWLGTVPAMVGLLRITGPLLARVRARMPAITAVALIAIGLGTLALRWRDIGTQQVTQPHCHQHSGASS